MKPTAALFSLFAIFAILLTACTLSSNDSSENTATTEPATPPAATAQPLALNAFFGAPEGQASAYGPIGCESYLVPVPLVELPADTPTDQQIAAALNALFGVTEQFTTTNNLFNALSLSALSVTNATVDANGLATVALSGDVMLSGVCADAIFAAQIETTAQQVSGVTGTSVTINGIPLADVISGRGE